MVYDGDLGTSRLCAYLQRDHCWLLLCSCHPDPASMDARAPSRGPDRTDKIADTRNKLTLTQQHQEQCACSAVPLKLLHTPAEPAAAAVKFAAPAPNPAQPPAAAVTITNPADSPPVPDEALAGHHQLQPCQHKSTVLATATAAAAAAGGISPDSTPYDTPAIASLFHMHNPGNHTCLC